MYGAAVLWLRISSLSYCTVDLNYKTIYNSQNSEEESYMVWFTPSQTETDIMKKIHEIAHDYSLTENKREALLRFHWARLEAAHGSEVLQIQAPSGVVVERPITLNDTHSWFTPTPSELSAIEQIETAFHDDDLTENQKQDLIKEQWKRLERAHGSKVANLVSPEGAVIERPL